MDLFTVLFYQPLFNFLVILYRLFSENLGLAIILIALLSRLLTLPVTLRQMKMMKTSNELNDKIKEIKKKHKNDKEKQQQEMMKVQSEYLPAQLAGCLPAILQFIFFINVYNVINNLIAHGAESFNTVAYNFVPKFAEGYNINTTFLGIIDLKTSAAQLGLSNPQVIPYIILIVLVGVTQYFSMKYMTGQKSVNDKKEDKSEKDKDKNTEDFSEILQQSSRQTAFLFPIMVSVISYSLASGLSLYWIVQSAFVIIQQLIMKLIRKDKANTSVL